MLVILTGHPSVASVTGQLTGHLKRFFYLSHGENHGVFREFPNDKERLQHIFANQVYGLAPTEIIYRIAIAYILGFSDEIKIEKHNLRQFDTLPAVQSGNLEQKLDEIYGN